MEYLTNADCDIQQVNESFENTCQSVDSVGGKIQELWGLVDELKDRMNKVCILYWTEQWQVNLFWS